MGFFIKQLNHSILLHPQYFSPFLKKSLEARLHEEVEGTCAGRYGYIIAVVAITTMGKGLLQPGTGLAKFDIEYSAVVFKPFKNEVVDGIVSTVNKIGFWADVGPLQVFVSQHLIPHFLKFDANSNPPAYIAEGEGGMDHVRIEKGEMVRIRIVGTRVDAKEIFAIGSIKEDYLGPTLEEENIIKMPASFGVDKSRRVRSDFTEGQPKSTWEEDQGNTARDVEIRTTTNKLSSGDDDDIPIIPDLEQVQEEEMAITVAMPPQMQVNNIQTIAEIEADLAETMGVGGMIASYKGIDMTLLAKDALVPFELIDDKDEIWEWDATFASLKSDLKKNIS